MAFPDFLGIGAMRAGTTWLHRQLRRHPGVWMPPVKGLHFFDSLGVPRFHDRSYLRSSGSRCAHYLRAAFRMDVSAFASRNLAWDARYLRRRGTFRWYASLFSPPPGLIAGEITPAYALLPVSVIRRIRFWNPALRIIFLMRDPIERAWSHAMKDLARDRRRHASTLSSGEVNAFLLRAGVATRCDYLETLQRWSKVFPADRIFTGYLDEIEEQPELFLDRLLRFLGVDPLTRCRAPDRELRRKENATTGYRIAIPPPLVRILAARFVGQTRLLAKGYGGYPAKWLAKMESLLRDA